MGLGCLGALGRLRARRRPPAALRDNRIHVGRPT
jgi:hypothetical protein